MKFTFVIWLTIAMAFLATIEAFVPIYMNHVEHVNELQQENVKHYENNLEYYIEQKDHDLLRALTLLDRSYEALKIFEKHFMDVDEELFNFSLYFNNERYDDAKKTLDNFEDNIDTNQSNEKLIFEFKHYQKSYDIENKLPDMSKPECYPFDNTTQEKQKKCNLDDLRNMTRNYHKYPEVSNYISDDEQKITGIRYGINDYLLGFTYFAFLIFPVSAAVSWYLIVKKEHYLRTEKSEKT